MPDLQQLLSAKEQIKRQIEHLQKQMEQINTYIDKLFSESQCEVVEVKEEDNKN